MREAPPEADARELLIFDPVARRDNIDIARVTRAPFVFRFAVGAEGGCLLIAR